MRVAAIYDIHGNLPALEAVLREVRAAGVDRIVVGGDVVPGPMPLETFERLLALEIPAQFILGNGDREVLSQMAGVETEWYRKMPQPWPEIVRWNALQLQDRHRRLMEGWPPTCRIEIPGLGPVMFCHATPRNDTEIFTRLTPEEQLLPIFAGLGVKMVVCGHTHMQFDRMAGQTRLINAGSVGMPFSGPGAFWLLLGPEVQLRRTSYDLEGAAATVRATAYPMAEDFAAKSILKPPTEELMLAQWKNIELK